MIWLWRKFTLWDYGTPEDPPEIPIDGWLGSVALVAGIAAAVWVVDWIVRG